MSFSLSEPVKSKLYVSRSTIKSSNSRHEKIITGHPFNHHLELFIPAPISSQQLKQFSKEIFYYKADIPLSYFLERSFVQNYVRSGRVIALSLSEGIDISDIISLDDTGNYRWNVLRVMKRDVGTLTLNLTKDTYEQLGLTGNPSKFGSKQRFVVKVDLLEKSMIPGKKGFERVKWCFNNSLTDPFSFLISFTNLDPRESQEINFPSTFNAKKLMVDQKIETLNDIITPEVDIIKDTTQEKQWRSDVVEIYDWIGLVSLKAQRVFSHDHVDPYISVYSSPEPNKSGDGTILRWTGFIPSTEVLSLFKLVSELDLPWAVISVFGFRDSPISWDKQEHGHFMSGENNYSFLIWPDGTYVLYQALGAHDNYS
ncbi:3963_t:CDS:2 [Acaulospora morrowiae]|uniref:3963_t:CDS:1 n=2 Tax=Acaulospora morrowiae TaxID=94023 RepID=A0A9N9DZI0_9GLOM|nr:3963_t:CDS:2 [Acaulospora morrowiae]